MPINRSRAAADRGVALITTMLIMMLMSALMIGLTSTVVDKDARVLLASLYGDHTDGFGGGGFSSYSVTSTFGDLDITTPAASAAAAATPTTTGPSGPRAFACPRPENPGRT